MDTDPTSRKAPLPNWANIGSFVVALIVLAGGTAVAYARLENRISYLEKELDAVVRSQPINAGAVPQKSDACAILAARFASAYENSSQNSVAEPLERLMERMGCAKPAAPKNY